MLERSVYESSNIIISSIEFYGSVSNEVYSSILSSVVREIPGNVFIVRIYRCVLNNISG